MKEDDQYMTKIKIMSVRDEDIPYINEWAKQNNVDVDLTKEMLTETTVDTVKGFDGLSSVSYTHLTLPTILLV